MHKGSEYYTDPEKYVELRLRGTLNTIDNLRNDCFAARLIRMEYEAYCKGLSVKPDIDGMVKLLKI